LRKAGHDVTNVDLTPSTFADRQYSVDLRDAAELEPIFRKYGTDGVFHVAAIADGRRALEKPLEAVDINIKGTAAVLDAARKAAVRRVFLSSTVWIYNAVDQS